MAKQHTVRALVPRDDVEELRTVLLDLPGADVDTVAVSAPDPATYRDADPEMRLRGLVKAGGVRLIVGALLGAVIGIAMALLLPFLREWAPWTVVLFGFGGAWGGGVAMAARGIQVNKTEDDDPDRTVEVDEQDREDVRVLTILVHRDRDVVIDLLSERGAVLLDSWHPKVGHGPDARPDDPSDPSTR